MRREEQGRAGEADARDVLVVKFIEQLRSAGRGANNLWDMVFGADAGTEIPPSKSSADPLLRSMPNGDNSHSISAGPNARGTAIPERAVYEGASDGLLPNPQDTTPTQPLFGWPGDPVLAPSIPGYEDIGPQGVIQTVTPNNGPIRVDPMWDTETADSSHNSAGSVNTYSDNVNGMTGGGTGIGVTSVGVANAATGARLADDLAASMSKPLVSDSKLRGFIDDLYSEGAKIGTGSTADAVRYEIRTGKPVENVFHMQKARDYSAALQKWLDTHPDASSRDRRQLRMC